MGEAGAAVLAEIERKRAELETITSNGKGYKSEIENQTFAINAENKAFCESAWTDVFKKYERWFPKTAIGTGTKDRFVRRLMTAYLQDHSAPLPIDELKNKASVLFARRPLRMEPYTLIDNSRVSSIEADNIWAKVIAGRQDVDIAGLISKLGNSDWVSKGVEYTENGSDVCPFCQQHTVTPDFRAKIQGFFDETYRQDIRRVNAKREEYKNAVYMLTRSSERLIELQKARQSPLVVSTDLGSILYVLKAVFARNLELISLKQKEPSRVIALTDTADVIGAFNAEISKSNASINAYNRLVDDFARERSILEGEIWKFFAAEYEATIAGHIRAVKGRESVIESLTRKREETAEKYKAVRSEIVRLENSVTSVTPAVNEINRLLKRYGFTGFQIQEVRENKNHYRIVRKNGEPAGNTLSEGETTFITFLYYLQAARGSFHPNGISTDRVLVIDDPVSSLDSNFLSVAGTMLKDVFTEICEGRGAARQAILLTHNVYFHKEIASLCAHCKWRGSVKYWVLRRQEDRSSIQDYGNQNPVTSAYKLM